MKKFDANVVLEGPRRVMQYVGMWPKTNPSGLYNLLGLFSFTITTIGTFLFLTKGLLDLAEGNYETGSYALYCMLVGAHAAFKIWFLRTNTAPFFEILTNLEDPSLLYHPDEFHSDLEDKMQFTKKIFNTLLIMCENAGTTLTISECAFGYSTNPRLFPIKTEDRQLTWYIVVGLIIGIFLFFLCAGTVIGAFEGLVTTFLSLGIAQLQILQKEIIHTIDSYPTDINLTKEEMQYYDERVNKQLSKCVKRHNAIERYIDSIETKYSSAFLIQYFVTLGVTGLIGLNFIFASITSADFLSCVCLFIADLIQVFVVCYHCNEIILESQNVRDACYLSNWTVCGPSTRKTLFIIMERTKRPFHCTNGKFSVISLETFVLVLKTSMSYFTVLKSMYADDPVSK